MLRIASADKTRSGHEPGTEITSSKAVEETSIGDYLNRPF
jgi:hypothetical protein